MASPTKGTDFGSESENAPQCKNHLLVIAIDEYAHCPKLNNCVKDAREFIDVLTRKYQFEPDNITALFNAEATRASILGRLNELKQKVSAEDNLVIYFSGHRETEDDVGYWAPVAAHPGHNWEFISTYDIKSRLDPISSFHTFVIVDACFSGALFSTYKSITPGYETKRSRWGLAASHSRERALDGEPGENSPFAATLLKHLKGSQDNLPIQELATEIIRRVEQVTEGRQTPVFKPLNVKGDDSGQYVFRLRKAVTAWHTAWAAIDGLPEESIAQLNTKILRLVEYAEQFSLAENISHALTLGEQLKQKREVRQRVDELKKGLTAQPESKHSSTQTPNFSLPKHSNTFTDPRDGQSYRTVELNGLRWMAQNLNYDVGEGCWFYDSDPKNGEKYGRLYTWEAAKKACPPGWRLPTDEEWKALAMEFGGYYDWPSGKDIGDPKKSYNALLEGGSTGFFALLGGYRSTSGSFGYLGDGGYYWSASENGSDYAWIYGFNRFDGRLLRDDYDKAAGLACRCVQDLTTLSDEALA